MDRVADKYGFDLLIAAFIVGVTGDALCRAIPWGINLPIWMAVTIAVMAILLHHRSPNGESLTDTKWLAVPTILFAMGFAWRDSATLRALDAGALAIMAGLVPLKVRKGRIVIAGIMEYVFGMFHAGILAIGGMFGYICFDIRWGELPRRNAMKHSAAVARGMALAVPPLIVFGALFMAADAAFQSLVENLIQIDILRMLSHIVIVVCLTWAVGGFFHGTLTSAASQMPVSAKSPSKGFFGIIETGTALGLMDLLFLAFVVVQFRYFFGGPEHVAATTNLTYSEYARRGFFELVGVAALVLPMLLVMHWFLRKEDPVHERIFRLLARVQVLLLFVIMVSAVQRMRLYQAEYGLTELRLYTTAFMAWLALVFVWFEATVLRGRRSRFAFGAMVTGLIAIGILHAMNPDAFIVRVNAQRVATRRTFDVDYATSLSADAVPALVAALPGLSEPDRRSVIERLRKRWLEATPSQPADWRSWNWLRARAARELQNRGRRPN